MIEQVLAYLLPYYLGFVVLSGLLISFAWYLHLFHPKCFKGKGVTNK